MRQNLKSLPIIIAAAFLISLIWIGFQSDSLLTKAGSVGNVSGYAWSPNIGWLSFNCDNNPPCAQNYGVSINPSTGLFSGYAWSPNIGWVSFNKTDLTGCPKPSMSKAALETK